MTNPNPYQSSSSESQPSHYDREVRLWSMLIHFSVLAGLVAVPIVGWILPIVLWQVKKDDMPEIDIHGKIVVNWLLSTLIYTAICIPLLFVFIGFPLLAVLYLANIVFSIIGGIKANDGKVWHYPLSFRFL